MLLTRSVLVLIELQISFIQRKLNNILVDLIGKCVFSHISKI